MRSPWACINEAWDPSGRVGWCGGGGGGGVGGEGGPIGTGMLCDRSWHMHTLTRSHVLVIS